VASFIIYVFRDEQNVAVVSTGDIDFAETLQRLLGEAGYRVKIRKVHSEEHSEC
jgi:hypothetical protein